MSTTRTAAALMVVGCSLQLAFVSGWIALGKGDAPAWTRWALAGIFVTASLIVIHKVSDLVGWRARLLCCGCLALTSVGIYQLLGFTLFPGLVKDVDLFTWGHLTTTLATLGLGFCGYSVLTLLAHLAPRRDRA